MNVQTLIVISASLCSLIVPTGAAVAGQTDGGFDWSSPGDCFSDAIPGGGDVWVASTFPTTLRSGAPTQFQLGYTDLGAPTSDVVVSFDFYADSVIPCGGAALPLDVCINQADAQYDDGLFFQFLTVTFDAEHSDATSVDMTIGQASFASALADPNRNGYLLVLGQLSICDLGPEYDIDRNIQLPVVDLPDTR